MKLRELLSIIDSTAKENNLPSPWLCGGVPRDRILGQLNKLNDLDLTTGNETSGRLSMLLAEKLKPYGAMHKAMNDGHSKVILGDLQLDFSSHFVLPGIEPVLKTHGIFKPTSLDLEMFSRDFTCNSLLLSMDLKELKDSTRQGLKDIKKRIICTCLHPNLTLQADPKRIVRGVYLASKLGFELSEEMVAWIRENLDVARTIDSGYVTRKLNKAWEYDAEKTRRVLEETGLNSVWITRLAENRVSVMVKEAKNDDRKLNNLKFDFSAIQTSINTLDFSTLDISVNDLGQAIQDFEDAWNEMYSSAEKLGLNLNVNFFEDLFRSNMYRKIKNVGYAFVGKNIKLDKALENKLHDEIILVRYTFNKVYDRLTILKNEMRNIIEGKIKGIIRTIASMADGQITRNINFEKVNNQKFYSWLQKFDQIQGFDRVPYAKTLLEKFSIINNFFNSLKFEFYDDWEKFEKDVLSGNFRKLERLSQELQKVMNLYEIDINVPELIQQAISNVLFILKGDAISLDDIYEDLGETYEDSEEYALKIFEKLKGREYQGAEDPIWYDFETRQLAKNVKDYDRLGEDLTRWDMNNERVDFAGNLIRDKNSLPSNEEKNWDD